MGWSPATISLVMKSAPIVGRRLSEKSFAAYLFIRLVFPTYQVSIKIITAHTRTHDETANDATPQQLKRLAARLDARARTSRGVYSTPTLHPVHNTNSNW